MNNTATHNLAIRGLLYKEWLKLRYLGWLPFALLLIGMLGTFHDLQGMKSASGGQALWNAVIYRNHMPFSSLRYLPLLAGVWLAAVQFAPECLNRRLRLFFHLPVNPHRALYLIMSVVVGLLGLLSGMLCLGLGWIFRLFMPVEVGSMVMLTLAPWCLVGFIGYAATALVLVETSTIRRLWHAAIGSIFAIGLLDAREYGSYIDGLPWFGLITLLWLCTHNGVLDRVKRGIA